MRRWIILLLGWLAMLMVWQFHLPSWGYLVCSGIFLCNLGWDLVLWLDERLT